MTIVEVICIAAGVFCICVSFFMARKTSGTQGGERYETAAAELWTEKDEEVIRERIFAVMEERQAELVDDTVDHMNRLCNEKIMAMDEFSSQILEKIDQNHQEVVFMYNLLGEKEKELKSMMAAPVRKKPAAEKGGRKVPADTQKPMPKKQRTETIERNTPVSAQPQAAESPLPEELLQQIRTMHRQGKSVLEISKELDIGQGEVKLVVALYGGRK